VPAAGGGRPVDDPHVGEHVHGLGRGAVPFGKEKAQGTGIDDQRLNGGLDVEFGAGADHAGNEPEIGTALAARPELELIGGVADDAGGRRVGVFPIVIDVLEGIQDHRGAGGALADELDLVEGREIALAVVAPLDLVGLPCGPGVAGLGVGHGDLASSAALSEGQGGQQGQDKGPQEPMGSAHSHSS
jgi:hypothetical protein